MSGSVLYVGLEEPNKLHRAILESQREVIVSLRRFELIHSLRREKLREFIKLRRAVNQATVMFTQLKAELPHVEVRLAKQKQVEEEVPDVTSSSDDAELRRLERELGDIESKLKRL